ncbi:MAG: hypothetical protein JXA30_02115 [Deltaproteobacteria bacterium]|nr:hypothetical protein [Deltaproteobacteria bacterium]
MEKTSLLKAKTGKKRALKKYTVLRCPMVGHQASWCRHLCRPSQGKGVCGRPATHHMKDKYQLAIAKSQRHRTRVSEKSEEKT